MEIDLKISEALGDTIITSRLLKSLVATLDAKTLVRISTNRRVFLEGLLNQPDIHTEMVELDYATSDSRIPIDISNYLDLPSNREGINYSETMIQMAEQQLRKYLGRNFRLKRDVKTEIIFDVEKYKEDIKLGRKKAEELKVRYDKKPIVWLGTRTTGSRNRMPQSYLRKANFWQELCDRLSGEFVLYELRAPNTEPIAKGIEPLEGENFSFPANSEVIKATSAGIGLDGMQVEWAYALGKPKMVILLGPTHPNAMIYPGEDKNMITIPSSEEVKLYANRCWGCGNLGYSNIPSFEEIRRTMGQRFPSFEFDSETYLALKTKDTEKIANASIRCRKLKDGEQLYDCWDSLTPQRVVEELKKIV